MSDQHDTTDPREAAAEAYGRDAHRHGVSIDGARAYGGDERIQRAWQRGWMEAESAERKQRGELGMEWMRYVR